MAEENKAQTGQTEQAQTVVGAPEIKAKKNKKINQMSLKEVEEKLSAVKEKMGRLDSRYAKELLKRKETLADKNKT